MTSHGWRTGFLCSKSQVNLNILLNCGQSFRWKRKTDNEWIGVIGKHVWLLHQNDRGVEYKVYGQQSVETARGTELCKPVHKKIKAELFNSNTQSGFSVKEIKTEVDNVKKRSRNSETTNTAPLNKKCMRSSTKSTVSKNSNNNKDEESIHRQSIEVKNSVKLEPDVKKETDGEFQLSSKDCEEILKDYFQFGVDLCQLYEFWSSRDAHFKAVATNFAGIRMLRQDPAENLISFVCSSNNHISRITSMVEKLCTHYGEFIAEVDGEKYFSFPAISALTGDGVEGHLRELGFGYRAKFISAIAKYITQEKGDYWLESLRARTYPEAKAELIKLMGVGAKVADCVCLMSLDKTEAVPVDTHVWQITVKNYLVKLRCAKSLTDKIYNEIGDFYRELWGPYAGWAHSVLFTADLKQNKVKGSDLLPPKAVSGVTKEGKTKKAAEIKADVTVTVSGTKRKKKGN